MANPGPTSQVWEIVATAYSDPVDMELGPVGPGGTREGFLAQVAQVALDRAEAWHGLVEVLAEPTEGVVGRLRSGELVALWRAGSQWLGEDSQVFTGALLSLDVYVRGAPRRDPADDARAYREGHARYVTNGADLAGRVAALAQQCRAEAAAWSAGDVTGGRALRAEQHAVLEAGLAEDLLVVGAEAGRHATTHLWRTLGKIVLALVTVESGRDYQRAVLGDSRRSPRLG